MVLTILKNDGVKVNGVGMTSHINETEVLIHSCLKPPDIHFFSCFPSRNRPGMAPNQLGDHFYITIISGKVVFTFKKNGVENRYHKMSCFIMVFPMAIWLFDPFFVTIFRSTARRPDRCFALHPDLAGNGSTRCRSCRCAAASGNCHLFRQKFSERKVGFANHLHII